jgi:hypothetical protein
VRARGMRAWIALAVMVAGISHSTASRAEPEPPSWLLRGSAGYAHRRLYGVPINALDVSAAVGGAASPISGQGLVDVLFGQTEQGLPFHQIGVGGAVEGDVGRLRIAGVMRVSFMTFGRATVANDIGTFGLGFDLVTSFDVVRVTPLDSVYLQAKLTSDLLNGGEHAPTAVLWGPSVALGYRFAP